MELYEEKTKDITTNQILFFFNRISPDTWTKVKAGVVLAPIALLYLLTYIISSKRKSVY